MTTPNDRFLTGSFTGSFSTRPTTGSPVPSPTGTGTGRSGSSRNRNHRNHSTPQHPTEPMTTTDQEDPMATTQLTADELTMTMADDVAPFPFIEDENANITGYGHQDKATFAAEVNRYDEYCNGEPYPEAEQWTADHVGYAWVIPPEDEGPFRTVVDGVPVTEATPGAMPLTILWNQR